MGRPLGGAFLGLGIVFLLFAVARYFHTQAVMAEGKFPATRGIVIIGAVGIMAVLVAIFVIVVTIFKGERGKRWMGTPIYGNNVGLVEIQVCRNDLHSVIIEQFISLSAKHFEKIDRSTPEASIHIFEALGFGVCLEVSSSYENVPETF
ncbi:hypothetical protein BC938DRAFT_477460 [Jimgerdemannia flammicorona]|uniref:DUF202 domain-containing protein n=1 Tax=Jimgerdemannia flammicorona TaxID=994334 RepID=A0A433QPA9_9FUNG|nr:hypothetical protein BC938DRAFT_477460 [Jimgerdemannia flammicorona]